MAGKKSLQFGIRYPNEEEYKQVVKDFDKFLIDECGKIQTVKGLNTILSLKVLMAAYDYNDYINDPEVQEIYDKLYSDEIDKKTNYQTKLVESDNSILNSEMISTQLKGMNKLQRSDLVLNDLKKKFIYEFTFEEFYNQQQITLSLYGGDSERTAVTNIDKLKNFKRIIEVELPVCKDSKGKIIRYSKWKRKFRFTDNDIYYKYNQKIAEDSGFKFAAEYKKRIDFSKKVPDNAKYIGQTSLFDLKEFAKENGYDTSNEELFKGIYELISEDIFEFSFASKSGNLIFNIKVAGG